MMASVALLTEMADAHVYHWQAPMTQCPDDCPGGDCPDLCLPTCPNDWDLPLRWILEVCEQPPCPGGVCPPPITCDMCKFDSFPDDSTDDATISFNNTTIGSFTMQLTTWLIDVLTFEASGLNSQGYTLKLESTSSSDTLTPDYVYINAKYADLTIIVRDGARIVTD